MMELNKKIKIWQLNSLSNFAQQPLLRLSFEGLNKVLTINLAWDLHLIRGFVIWVKNSENQSMLGKLKKIKENFWLLFCQSFNKKYQQVIFLVSKCLQRSTFLTKSTYFDIYWKQLWVKLENPSKWQRPRD